MADNYSFKDYRKDTMARASGRSLPISFKISIEICNFLRKKKVSDAKNILQRVIKQEQAIPLKRFNRDVGHKPGKIAGGRYPVKASQEFLGLISSAESNAQFKGMNTSNLVITHILANKGVSTRRFGRQRSRSAKRTNIELVVEEKAEKKSPKAEKAVEKKQPEKKVEAPKPAAQETKKEPKQEAKKEEKKAEVKQDPKPQEKKEEKKQ